MTHDSDSRGAAETAVPQDMPSAAAPDAPNAPAGSSPDGSARRSFRLGRGRARDGGPGERADAATTAASAPPGRAQPAAPKTPKTVVCPVCATSFSVRGNGGKCPVCGEQVLPRELAVANIPVASPASAWLRDGGWRIVALIALVLYQLVLFGLLVHHFIDLRAL